MVTAHHKSSALGFLLLGPDGTHELAIGDIFEAMFGDVCLVDDFDSVGALYLAVHTISKVAAFVGR